MWAPKARWTDDLKLFEMRSQFGAWMLVTTSSLASASGQVASDPPVFGTEIELVAVPVYVRDRDGHVVEGLSPSDFAVFDDGQAVRVEAVYEVDAAARDPRENGRSDIEAAAVRQFLLLFDLSFSHAGGIVRARRAAIDFVRDRLAPADLAGVATYSANTGVRVLVNFTTDRDQLARAIAALDVVRRERVPDPLTLVYELDGPRDGSAGDAGAGALDNMVESYVRATASVLQQSEDAAYRRRVLEYLAELRKLAEGLDIVRGRKQVVLFSSGFDDSVLMGRLGREGGAINQAIVGGRAWSGSSDDWFGGQTDTRRVLEETLRDLAASDSTIHALDVSGLAAATDISEPVGATRRSGGESLTTIARGSGGVALRHRNDFGEAFGEILEATRHYYVVAFQRRPSDPAGQFRSLEIRVDRGDVRVSHRSGYSTRDVREPPPRGRARVEAAEAIAKGIVGGDIVLEAMAVPYRDAEGLVSVPVILDVEGASLFRGQADTEPVQLELFGYALSEDGRIVDLTALPRRLDLRSVDERIRAHGLQFVTSFPLGTGRWDLRFYVRAARHAGSARASLEVPDFSKQQLVLYPPIFMTSPHDLVILPAPSRASKRLDIPFRVGNTPFTMRTRPSLANGRAERICVMAFASEVEAEYAVSARLLSPSGAAVGGGQLEVVDAVAEDDGFVRYVLRFTPSDIAPGRYDFQVEVENPATGRLAMAALPVSVDR